jgi:hypothetical protein
MGSSWRRQHQLEARLGDNLTRPKGMHDRTHQRLMREIVQCWETRDLALADFMARMNSRLRKLDDFGIDLSPAKRAECCCRRPQKAKRLSFARS